MVMKMKTGFDSKLIAKRLTRMTRVREVESTNPRLVKCFTAEQTVRHRFNIYASSCATVCRGDGHCKLVTRFGVIRRV